MGSDHGQAAIIDEQLRKGTPLFDARLSEEKVVAILAHMAEGVGVRKTGRLTGVSNDTVVRYCLRAGAHVQQLISQSSPQSGGTPMLASV